MPKRSINIQRMRMLNSFSSAVMFLCVAAMFSLPLQGEAKITGDCEACHAKFPGMMEKKEPGKPLKFVLQSALCVDCHTGSDKETVKRLGGANVPVILNQSEPIRPLAGGNFFYLKKADGDLKGHNVDRISGPDQRTKGNPPGYERISDPSAIGYNPNRPLTCAGSNGCHGDRNIEDPFIAVMGSHHADDEPIDGSTTAKSYRYLRMTPKVKGVLGTEDPQWEYGVSSRKHNEYSPTMNLLCRNCHGNFHGKENVGKASPWLKHPLDVVLPNRGEYLQYNPSVPPPQDRQLVRIYHPDAPVARGPLSEEQGEIVTPDRDMVMCLSCHVAHAGPYNHALRWEYDELEAAEGGKGACFICHTKKNQ